MEVPFNILILPFLGGYIFVRFFNYTKIHTMRSDKDRIVIRSAIVGLFAVIVAFALYILGKNTYPCQPENFCLGTTWREIVPFEYSGISFGAFLIASLGWIPLNLLFFGFDKQIDRAIAEDSDPLELLLKRAQDEELAVSITMLSEKVYIGIVTHQFNPTTPTNNIGLLPLQSGYRKPDTKEMVLTINYSQAIKKITDEIDEVAKRIKVLEEKRVGLPKETSDEERKSLDNSIEDLQKQWQKLEQTTNLFVLVLPVNQIASANIFDNEIHTKYFLPSPTE